MRFWEDFASFLFHFCFDFVNILLTNGHKDPYAFKDTGGFGVLLGFKYQSVRQYWVVIKCLC